MQQLLAILEDSTGSMQGTQEDPAAGSRAARQAWWSKRQALDARMQGLLHTLQASLGPWRWVPLTVPDSKAVPDIAGTQRALCLRQERSAELVHHRSAMTADIMWELKLPGLQLAQTA